MTPFPQEVWSLGSSASFWLSHDQLKGTDGKKISLREFRWILFYFESVGKNCPLAQNVFQSPNNLWLRSIIHYSNPVVLFHFRILKLMIPFFCGKGARPALKFWHEMAIILTAAYPNAHLISWPVTRQLPRKVQIILWANTNTKLNWGIMPVNNVLYCRTVQ